MAGGIDWFRWHHGSVSDPKFQLVARKSGASVPDVIAVWAAVLEAASQAEDRGTFELDAEAIDCAFGFPENRTADILKAMQERDLIDGMTVTSWAKRQPKRERTDDNSTARVQAFRQRENQETPRNATERHETPRGEESREEKKEQEKEPTVLVVCNADAPYRVPDCPYESLLDSYHEHCPTMPRMRVMTNMRQKHTRARWVAVASTDKLDANATLDWFVWFFKRASASPFLSGRVTRGKDARVWKADFEWLMTAGNFAKVIEGRYHEEAA